MKDIIFDELCIKVMSTDESIRFVAIANNTGVMVASAYRRGLTPLMTREDTSRYALQAVTRAMLRQDFTSKIGEPEYSITKYQKLIRALIPFEFMNDIVFMLTSYDIGSNPMEIIENKVIPCLQNQKNSV